MKPLAAIYPFSPFSPSGLWTCCHCDASNPISRTSCLESWCRHPVCPETCIVIDRRGRPCPRTRLPVNWTCRNAFHGAHHVVHSVGELLAARDQPVACWCGAPVYSTGAVYDQWGLLMADELVEAGLEDCPFEIEPPRFVLGREWERQLAAGSLRMVEGMEVWEPVVNVFDAVRAREREAKEREAKEREAKEREAEEADAREREAEDKEKFGSADDGKAGSTAHEDAGFSIKGAAEKRNRVSRNQVADTAGKESPTPEAKKFRNTRLASLDPKAKIEFSIKGASAKRKRETESPAVTEAANKEKPLAKRARKSTQEKPQDGKVGQKANKRN